MVAHGFFCLVWLMVLERLQNCAMFKSIDFIFGWQGLAGRFWKISNQHRWKGGPHLIERADEIFSLTGRINCLMELPVEFTILGDLFWGRKIFHF